MTDQKPQQNNTSGGAARGRTLPGTARLNALTDGVIAIAITLLALSFDVPSPQPGTQLGTELLAMLPLFEMYVVSFFLIGYFWNIHHSLFHNVDRHDTTLLWVNLLWLLPLTTLPFTTELVGKYRHDRIATALYFATLGLAAIFQAVLWIHARKGRYTVAMTPEATWQMDFDIILPLVVFGLGLALSWSWPQVAQRVYLLVFFAPLARRFFAPEFEPVADDDR
jgi:uncharacterized membrane protein